MTLLTRRAFLKIAGLSALAAATGCKAGETPDGQGAPTGLPAGATPVPAMVTLPPAPLEIVITPQGELYVQSYSEIASVDEMDWSLTLDGLVENPRTLSYADVLALPRVTEVRTLECIGNPVGGGLVGNVEWGGFYLKDLLDEVKVRPEAIRAKFTAADDYQTSVDLNWITQPGVLMAYEINGEPLAAEHGYPLRILMPGLYGQKMPKWIERIEFIDKEFLGYWERNGWSDTADVQTNSIIRQPENLQEVNAAETVPIFGIAFAGLRKITKVEVQVGDDETWREASLLQGDTPLIWTQWSFDWTAEQSGRIKIAVRATDEEGFVQSSTGGGLLQNAFPNGTTKIHSVVLRVG